MNASYAALASLASCVSFSLLSSLGAQQPVRNAPDRHAELEQLAAAAGDSAHAQLQLARTAWGWGLTADMERHLDRCVEQAQPGTVVHRQLDEFLATLEPWLLSATYDDATPRERVRGLVRQARPGVGAGKMAAIVELLARAPGAGERADAVASSGAGQVAAAGAELLTAADHGATTGVATGAGTGQGNEVDAELRVLARTETRPEQRCVALTALQRRGGKENARLVAHRSVMDKDEGVRRAAAALVRASGATGAALRCIAPGLMNEVPAVRIHTAEAMAELGDSAAIPVLVEAGPLAGTPPQATGGSFEVRAHMYQMTQRSYVRDFDVEIAQAAAVANPVIGQARDGVVLDVTVVAVVSRRVEIELAYRHALTKLTGADPGADPKAWAQWLAARGSG